MGKWLALAFIAGCATNAPAPDPAAAAQATFDRSVYPILMNSCAGNTAGCHAASPTDPGAHINALALDSDASKAYQSVLLYAGDFTASAPLLTAHATYAYLNPDAQAVIEDWFEQEREARGL